MDTGSLPPEEAIRAKEAALKGSVIAAWICLICAILFALLGNSAFRDAVVQDEAQPLPNKANWIPFLVMCFLTLLCAGLSVMAWCFVVRDRRLLTQLWAIAPQEATPDQPGVWPPPPSVPKG